MSRFAKTRSSLGLHGAWSALRGAEGPLGPVLRAWDANGTAGHEGNNFIIEYDS